MSLSTLAEGNGCLKMAKKAVEEIAKVSGMDDIEIGQNVEEVGSMFGNNGKYYIYDVYGLADGEWYNVYYTVHLKKNTQGICYFVEGVKFKEGHY